MKNQNSIINGENLRAKAWKYFPKIKVSKKIYISLGTEGTVPSQ